MRVFILSNDDLTSNIIFSKLLLNEDLSILGVAFSKTLNKKRNLFLGTFYLLEKMDFFYWAYLVFINLCYKSSEFLLSKLHWLFQRSSFLHISILCKKKKVPVYKIKDVNSKKFTNLLKELNPDIIIIRINQILGDEILSIPKYGTWCVHSSILPSYQGIAAEFHALRNEEPLLGSTVFKVSPELDKGPPLLQAEFKRNIKNSVFHHMIYNNHLAGEILNKAINLQAKNNLVPCLVRRKVQKSYYSWPLKGQVKQFKENNGKLISFKEAFQLACFGVFAYKPRYLYNEI